MKTSSTLLLATLFLIANYAVNASANPVFSSSNFSAQAVGVKEGGRAKKPKKEKKSKAKKGGGVSFHDGSAESRAERDKRLSRECKGKPNAGACEGYTR
jgi:hypothetical protein